MSQQPVNPEYHLALFFFGALLFLATFTGSSAAIAGDWPMAVLSACAISVAAVQFIKVSDRIQMIRRGHLRGKDDKK
jgi:hypothetical protein